MTDTSKTVSSVQGISEKPPMVIELSLNFPIGTPIEKIFAAIKKIDEARDFNHELHLKIDCETF